MEFTLNAPMGILFLSPIENFIIIAFMKRSFNKETIRLVKETSDTQRYI